METKTYVRKSFSVDAIQVTDDNIEEVAEWVGGDIRVHTAEDGSTKRYVKVRVHHPLNPRQTEAYVGDWVLSSSTGFKVYQDKPFKNHFDLDQSKLQQLSAQAEDIILKIKGGSDD